MDNAMSKPIIIHEEPHGQIIIDEEDVTNII